MSNYATRTDLEKATGVDTDLDLDSLKAEIDNTYVDKLKIVDLSKLGKVVNNEVLKFRKKKYLILVNLLKEQIIMLKLLK